MNDRLRISVPSFELGDIIVANWRSLLIDGEFGVDGEIDVWVIVFRRAT